MSQPQAVTQSEFSRIYGVGRSYVTALKKADRLVLDERGQVLVEASIQRINETADPNRDDVAARWAAERQATPPAAPVEPPEDEPTQGGHDYQKSRAQKEHYLAEQARIQFERDVGKLVEKSEVEAAVGDLVTTFRQTLENLPHRTAPELVGKDLDAIRATLKQEVHAALADMEREFTKRLNQMGSEE